MEEDNHNERLLKYSDEEWIKIIEGKYDPDYNILINSLKSGISSKLRGKIWIYLSKCLETASQYSSNLYDKLLCQPNEKAIIDINKDLNRTIASTNDEKLKESLKKKEGKLYNILLAYANFDEEVGYVQGNNYIVNTILSNTNSERAGFWMYFHIMNDLNWRYLYINEMPKLKRMINILKDTIKTRLPLLFDKIIALGSGNEDMFSAMFTSFFVCIFSYNSSIEYSNRVFDLFWILEEKIIIECIIHLLNLNQVVLIDMELDQFFPFVSHIVDFSVEKFGIERCFPNMDKYD